MTKRRIVIISAIVSVIMITVAGISDTVTLQLENGVTVSEQTLSCATYTYPVRDSNQVFCAAEGWLTDPHGNAFWDSHGCNSFPYGLEPSDKHHNMAIPSEIVCPSAKKENISSERSCFETSGCVSQWFPDLKAVPTFIYCPADAGIIDNGNIVFLNSACYAAGLWRLP